MSSSPSVSQACDRIAFAVLALPPSSSCPHIILFHFVTGPLFNFDVHEDVRLLSDATVEKDESHAGKVVLRSWYEKNKHIFPASRWEPYDPEKKWDKYTIR